MSEVGQVVGKLRLAHDVPETADDHRPILVVPAVSVTCVNKWSQRFKFDGFAGLSDKKRRPSSIPADKVEQVLTRVTQPPKPRRRWSVRTMTAAVGISPDSVHLRFHLHFTPTSSSWLKLVERFFAELTQHVIREGSFTGVKELVRDIETYLADRNLHPKPYRWKAAGEKILGQIHRARQALETQRVGPT